MIFRDCTQLISSAEIFNSLFPGAVDAFYRSSDPYETFPNACAFFAYYFQAFLVGLVVSCCRGKKSVIEGEVEADDSDLSDDEYVH